MTLTELINEVYIITNRRDLVNETLSAIRSSTLKAHHVDFFYKDIFETGVAFTENDYNQYIEYRTLVPRWRAVKYIRKYQVGTNPAPGKYGDFFTLKTPENTLDDYGLTEPNIYYIAGESIQLRSTTKIQNALLGCYINPLIGGTNETYSSWIAIDNPWLIINWAAMYIFRAIGKLDEASMQEKLAAIEVQLLIQSNVIAEGY